MPVSYFPELDALIRECDQVPLYRPERDPKEVARLAAYHAQHRPERLAAMKHSHRVNRAKRLLAMRDRRVAQRNPNDSAQTTVRETHGGVQ